MEDSIVLMSSLANKILSNESCKCLQLS